MKITIESTSKVVTLVGLDGQMPARIWEGFTDSGIPVHCYITRIAAEGRKEHLAQFEKELQEQRNPSADVAAIPLRLIL